jgi:hypothetical protein
MTMVQSFGVSTLVTLMSADRLSIRSSSAVADLLAREAIEACLQAWSDQPVSCRRRPTEPLRPYS